jgi:hypothetical protein
MLMARTASKATTKESPDDVIARGADVPLELARSAAPRDALVDPLPTDYVPDNEEKGYHVGVERQPAEPVLTRSGDVSFESIAEQPSKFATEGGVDLIDALKAAHNEADASRDDTEIASQVVTTRDEALGRTPAPETPAESDPVNPSPVDVDLDAPVDKGDKATRGSK